MIEIHELKPDIGDTIQIINMLGEPNYSGKSGIIKSIDSMGQLHCEGFGLAVIPDMDDYEVIERASDVQG